MRINPSFSPKLSQPWLFSGETAPPSTLLSLFSPLFSITPLPLNFESVAHKGQCRAVGSLGFDDIAAAAAWARSLRRRAWSQRLLPRSSGGQLIRAGRRPLLPPFSLAYTNEEKAKPSVLLAQARESPPSALWFNGTDKSPPSRFIESERTKYEMKKT
ncbi:uncharacterized protein LOC131004450 [Salvia miltiorrhiza]|uniref:uncharacterized protein LOC131004450 n=1 Tax=Salvia miltiorrhiza TaxID=226208 RepID=UPI0025AD26D8|nr:uncharacterized protein LOC131004450 [Salvia miltiorrhiza]